MMLYFKASFTMMHAHVGLHVLSLTAQSVDFQFEGNKWDKLSSSFGIIQPGLRLASDIARVSPANLEGTNSINLE